MKTNKATILLDAKATLGEGPVWDWKRKCLFWVAIEGCVLHAYYPLTDTSKSWHFKAMIGAAIPAVSGKLWLALTSGLAAFEVETANLSEQKALKNKAKKIRFNDGKVGPNGHLWLGSMHLEAAPKTGNLYRVAPNLETTIQVPKTTISNGMAWTSDHKTFYYIDSPTYEICQYDFDTATSEITNRKVAFKVPKAYGAPDGMCIDAENMLWVAHWGGHCVRRWNPETGEVLEKINLPAPQVTSCCFGGEKLSTLYITTARSGMTAKALEKFPLSGGLFKYEPKVLGTPITYFKDNVIRRN